MHEYQRGRISILIFVSIFSVLLFRPGPARATFTLEMSEMVTPFVVSVTPAIEVRERFQDVVGRLQSVTSHMRGIIQDARSYTQALVRERGVDVGDVDRLLGRAEDQLNRADAQVITLSQLTVEIDVGTSDEMVLSHAKTQLRFIKTTLLSGRDLLRDVLGGLRVIDQRPTPTLTGVPVRVTVTPTP